MDTGWLREMGEERLARLLLRRPDVARPAPASLLEVGSRLANRAAVWGALRDLPRPTVQVAEAILALGGATDRSTLMSLFGRSDEPTAAAVGRALTDLVDHGLAARDGPVHRLVATARDTFPDPLQLGASAEPYLNGLPLGRLTAIGAALGVRVLGRRREAVAGVLSALRDHDRLTAVLAAAPPTLAAELRELAATGGVYRVPYQPHSSYYGLRSGLHLRADAELAWAIERCLLIPIARLKYALPSEVALALRGPDYRAPFDPDRPPAPRAAADDAVVARDAAAAAGVLLRVAVRLMDDISRGEVALLRSGGVGLRELRRLAWASGATVEQVRVALAAAHGAALLGFADEALVPTEHYDAWLAQPPPERVATLVWAWAALPYAPLATPGAWAASPVDGPVVGARRAVLRLLVSEPGAPTDDAAFADLLAWRYPVLLRDLRLPPAALATACRAEAATLGVVGAGAVSGIGRALLGDDHAALAAALTAVGEAVRSAHLQADLTAVVAGPPDAALADLLGELAERESSGAASTWRFTPDSVRRAFDTGWTADRLLAALTEVAAGEVPQALSYLVRDVQRRHGVLRAFEVRCCVHSADTALLAEVAADRRLRPLAPRLLAPTVLVSAWPLAETIDALRRAGYAPVAEAADGTTVVERPARRRAAAVSEGERPPRDTQSAPAFSMADALELARALLARPDGGSAPPPDDHHVDDLDYLDMEEAAAIFGELGDIDPDWPDPLGDPSDWPPDPPR